MPRPSPRKDTRLTIRMPEALHAEIVTRSPRAGAPGAESEEGPFHRSSAIREMLERYLAMLSDGRKEVARKLSAHEFFAVLDVMHGTYTGGDPTWISNPVLAWEVDEGLKDGLAEKYQVDGPALVEKLKKLSLAERAALLDAVDRYWLHPEGGNTLHGAEVAG